MELGIGLDVDLEILLWFSSSELLRNKYYSTRGDDSELLAGFALRASIMEDNTVCFTSMAVFAQARYSEVDIHFVLTLVMSCFASSERGKYIMENLMGPV